MNPPGAFLGRRAPARDPGQTLSAIPRLQPAWAPYPGFRRRCPGPAPGRLRGYGFTLLEVMVAAALSALAALIFLAFLTSGYNFVLATESFGVQAASARNALDRMVRLGSTATSHQVYASYAAYTTGTPVSPPGTPGACLRLVTPTGNWVFWRDSATSELRYLQEGTARRGVLARGITDFQARCLFADQVQVTLTATTASASDINTTLTVTSSVYHRNGTTGPCTLGPLRRRPA